MPIDPSGAEWIVAHGIQLVGIDYLSVGAYEGGIPTHEILLGNGVVPVEGLNLAGIEAGEYQLDLSAAEVEGLRRRAGPRRVDTPVNSTGVFVSLRPAIVSSIITLNRRFREELA